MADTIYQQESGEIRAFLSDTAHEVRVDEKALANHAGQLLDRFAERIRLSGTVPQTSAGPARYAMAVLIDKTVRDLSTIRTGAWSAAAHSPVFDRRDITADDIRKFAQTAAEAGPTFAPLEAFLIETLEEIDGRQTRRRGASRATTLLFGLSIVLYVVALGGYAAFLDNRYHQEVLSAFETQVGDVPEGRNPDRLADIARLHDEATKAIAAAPLNGTLAIPFWGNQDAVDEIYRNEVQIILPDALREAIGEAFESEGESIELYDTLRAWSILTGRSAWSSSFLSGWVEEREERLGLAGLARHVEFLDGPEPRLAVPDQALLQQARDIAKAATQTERAFLELMRLPEMRDLPPWQPTAHIPEFDSVFVMRSGARADNGLEGAFAKAGWDLARAGAVDRALRIAQDEAKRLSFEAPKTIASIRSDVLATLQNASLVAWRAWLEDVRVRPFSDPKSATAVSGALSREGSPLAQVIEEVWREAGGDDPTRPLQAKRQIEDFFGPSLQYVRSDSAKDLAGLFGALNVALSTWREDEERGTDALMSVQERALSIAALRNAPPLVAQIAEDVLAQTSSTHARILSNPLTREWQARIYPLCQRAVDGRYPFHPGTDVDIESFDAFFGASGALNRFFNQFASQYIETSAEVWRWSTDARLTGLDPESAVFLQRAMMAAQVFYRDDGTFGSDLKLTPWAESAETVIDLGGARVSVGSNDGALSWPGPVPDSGVRVAFSSVQGSGLSEPGTWGLLKLLDRSRVRMRDDGRRHLVDLRVAEGRVFFELQFPSVQNPVAARVLLRGMTCPPVL